MSDDALPQADQIEGAPHPRETQQLIGQSAAETAFLDAYKDDRLHHAWLITGPRGVGKATLAWRLARFLLTVPSDDGGMFDAPPPPDSLETDPNHPVHAAWPQCRSPDCSCSAARMTKTRNASSSSSPSMKSAS
jgi:DNA polymerase-3 subunit delta'